MFQPLRAMLREPETRVLVVAALTVVAVGTVAYVLIEGWTVLDAVYFCVVTLATVGFGDLHPTTELGRLFTIGYIIVGVGIIAAFISQLASHRQSGAGRNVGRRRGRSGRLIVDRIVPVVHGRTDDLSATISRRDSAGRPRHPGGLIPFGPRALDAHASQDARERRIERLLRQSTPPAPGRRGPWASRPAGRRAGRWHR